MKSWEVLREAADRIGVKALAARLHVSTALVYKWCQEPPGDEVGGSGARNPLDRLAEIYDATRDPRVINWLCHRAGGFFVSNPEVEPGQQQEQLLGATQQVVNHFSHLLDAVSRSIANDGQITADEAEQIREAWERLKRQAEMFVVACERGLYRSP